MENKHLRERLASLGLITVLLLLAVCSIGSTVITWHVSNQSRQSVYISDLYQQAHYLVQAESAELYAYALAPTYKGWADFRATAQQLDNVLQTVGRVGEANDHIFVQSMQVKHSSFLLMSDQFFALIDNGNQASAVSYYNRLLKPICTDIGKQVDSAATREHQIAVDSLATLDSTQQVVMICTILMFTLGLGLLLLFFRMLRHYQSKLHEVAQAELIRMQEVALTDPLTGLPNHRTMMDRIEQEVLNSQTTQHPCAIVFVDLDHFKSINDTWGHRAGDAVLCEVAQRLKHHIRQNDAVGRYGGEEFVMVLTHIDVNVARLVAERIRAALEAEPCVIKGEEEGAPVHTISVTGSIGVAIYQEHGCTRETLIEAADRAMYCAKTSGRNRVCLAGEEPGETLQTLDDRIAEEQFTEAV